MERGKPSLFLRLEEKFPSNGHQRVLRTREGIELDFRKDRAFEKNAFYLLTLEDVREIAQKSFPQGARVNYYPRDKRIAVHFDDSPERFVTIHAPYTAPHLTIGFGEKDGDITTSSEIKDYIGFTWEVYQHCLKTLRAAKKQINSSEDLKVWDIAENNGESKYNKSKETC